MSKKIFIIAELSANHNQDFDLAVETIEAIAKTGADAVKVQTYTADSLTLNVDNKYFSSKKDGLWKGIRPYDLFKEGAMPYEWQPKLKEIAEKLGLIFFSTPFDKEGVDFLESIDIPIYKIASFEITDIPLIKYVAKKQKPIIISTGVADIEDIQLAIQTCRKEGNENITLLKCTSEYPANIENANLLTMVDMENRFDVQIGLSDHSLGWNVALTAAALGAKVIEKHFILSRELGGPDSAFSMEPSEFEEMVKKIRDVEKILGEVKYEVSEKDKLRRRSLFISQNLKIGDKITSENIKSVRPGYGLHPKYYEQVLGKKVKIDLNEGEPFKMEYLI